VLGIGSARFLCSSLQASQIIDESDVSDERQTIERVLSGDTAAFADLINNHKAHVLRIAANMVPAQDVEEVAHEVFIRAFKDLSSFSSRAPFEHWLSKIAVRTSYDHWRRHRKQKIVQLSPEQFQLLENEIDELSRAEAPALERAKELLDMGLSCLEPQDRLAFSLLYLEGMTMKEVSKVLGWSIAQVKIRSFRSRQRLHKNLEACVYAAKKQ